MSTWLNYRLPRYLIKQHPGCFPEGDEGCCCSVAQSCPTLCDPMDCSISVLSVLHHLPKFARVHVHCMTDAIQPSPLMLFSPSALSLSQHQGLLQWVICSHQMTKILELQLQHLSFPWIFRVDLPHNWLVWSPCCPRDFQESSAHSSKASFILVEEWSFYFLQNLSFNTSNRFFPFCY